MELQKNHLILFPIFVFWLVVGFILQVFWEVPDFLAFSKPLFLVFYAFALVELTMKQVKPVSRYFFALIIVCLVTFFIEAWSVATGFPFGTYHYSAILGPKFFGVPITIALAWVGVLLNSLYVATQRNKHLRAIETGIWIVVIDLILDPVAEASLFWEWGGSGSGGYFGIPLSNFISWYIIGAALSYLFPLYSKQKRTHRKVIFVFQGMLFMFGMIGVRLGLIMIGILSILFILLIEGRYQYDYRKQK
ncbi:carotenoid biosynthesis protein [Paraliobacillus salinarum]|uniref:carotenoid biosynthesis protein n=1 Tax=Paraliobacillus salinarum TaxID=1158996 RepID=UPI0015F6C5C0|nr:carotenoid biosynthesis protein [Paraliobacillus salinarum]